VEKLKPSGIAGGTGIYVTLENSLAVSQRLNIELPQDPAIPPLGIYLGDMKTYACTKTYKYTQYYS
jgi:hypothetical protein